MSVTLPRTPDVAVELLYWNVGRGGWLSPMTGEVLDPQPDRPLSQLEDERDWAFVFRIAGEAVRILGGDLFDRRTKVRLSSKASWGALGDADQTVMVTVEGRAAHRSDFLVELSLAYGPADQKTIALTEGARQSFGDSVEIEAIGTGPGAITIRYRHGRPLTTLGLCWEPSSGTPGLGWAAFSVFPAGLTPKLQTRVLGESRWRDLHGLGKLPTVEGIPVSASTIELRYLAHAARVQFMLPEPLPLPEATNLFNVDLGRVSIPHPRALILLLKGALQLQVAPRVYMGTCDIRYPIEMDRATPMDLLDVIRREGSVGAYADTREFRLRDDRGSPGFERVEAWLEAQARRLGL